MEGRADVDGSRPVKRARVTKPGSWDDFKDDIHDLYAVKNYSIEDLMSAMANKGLHASRRTYMKRITEWGFQKKIRRAEKEAMLRIERRRSAVGKRTSFRIRGQEVTAAKLKRAAVAVEEDDNAVGPAVDADNEPEQADTPSCISYGTPEPEEVASPAKVDIDSNLPNGEIPSIHTAAWADDPAAHFWKTRNMIRDVRRITTVEEPVVIDDLPTYGVERSIVRTIEAALPTAYERDVVPWYDVGAPESGSESDYDDEDGEGEEVEFYREVTPPKPFKLKRFLTSSIPSLNYELKRANVDMRLEGGPRPMIEGLPLAAESYAALLNNAAEAESAKTDIEIKTHFDLFDESVSQLLDDETRNQRFSDLLGILKAKYDRESATLNLMAMVFDDGAVVTEEQVRDKMEALIDSRHRHFGFEAQTTLDACMAGVILMLDANRLDAEQQTWQQDHVRGRLDRTYQLMMRIFSSRLPEDTVLELMGDAEAKDVMGSLAPDAEGRTKAGRMMRDVALHAMESTTVLHALELLSRYHRQFSAWHLQERVRSKPFLFTR